jgi:hypothetical protein
MACSSSNGSHFHFHQHLCSMFALWVGALADAYWCFQHLRSIFALCAHWLMPAGVFA